MKTERHQRQSFLGETSVEILQNCRVAVVGLGGGGSHIVQQLAHIGVGKILVLDPDVVEEGNLNRLVGAVASDVVHATRKVDVAVRVVQGVDPTAEIIAIAKPWEAEPDLLRDRDVIFGCLDRYAARDELERLARRLLIPYLDIGMDVHSLAKRYLISGQVAASIPGRPCLWCMALLTETLLGEEAARYGQAGGRPQVVWPNGVLASTAVGLFMQMVTPWHSENQLPVLLEYDGNAHTVLPSNKLMILNYKTCHHYPTAEVGDPFFKM